MKIKYPAVIVATLIHFLLGGLWYSPLLFGNKFLQIINWSPETVRQISSQSHAKELTIAFVTSLILVYILAHFVQYTKATNVAGGMQTAFWLCLYLINIGYQFVGCVLAGVILAVWRPREAAEVAAQAA